jgi:ribosomal protein L11 methyltransferase
MTTQPHWLETRWSLPKAEVDALTARLELLNCLGSFETMGLDDAEEAKRTLAEVVAYFPDGDAQHLQSSLKPLLAEAVQLQSLTRLPQGDWATAWKKYFKPFFLTPEILIRPSWEEYTPVGDEKILTLDPGMAFGTGQHDTTRFCAEFLCELASKQKGQSLLDVGCGSGILSLIGKAVGFAPVTGVDNDPAAIETAIENRARNPQLEPVTFLATKGELTESGIVPADVLVANIIAEALCELKAALIKLVRPGGQIILSGILPERAHLVTDAYKDLELLSQKTSVGWHAYLYRRV